MQQTLEVTSLAQSVDPLRDWFNANAGLPRLLVILSAT